ncbi:MAG: M23 family metallopeptidase [Deltaproteobacteria bacterium]|nr:M23 family metallopeptidase [Deltaproteobacteria bacterium]
MRKFLSSALVALVLTASTSLFAAIPSSSFEEDGGTVDFDLDSAPNFYMEDANDLTPSLEAAVPSVMPCAGIITSDYGWRRLSRSRGRMHLGVDIAAPYGSPVLAPADGKVAFVGHKNGYGLTVIIDHGGNLTTLFAHNSEAFVSEGESIKKGQEISRIGMSGHSTGPHVHYEVRIDGNAVNPSKFL